MTRRIDKKEKEIRPISIAATVAGNIVLVIMLSLAVAVGLMIYVSTTLQNELERARDDMQLSAASVDKYFAEGIANADRFAGFVAESYYGANTSQSLFSLLSLIKTLGDYSDIGVMEESGAITSTNGTVRDAKYASFYQEALAGKQSVYAIEADGVCGVAFASPIQAGDRTLGVLYITDFDPLISAALPDSAGPCYLLDAADEIVCANGNPDPAFDYAKVTASGLNFKRHRSISILPLIKAFRIQRGSPDETISLSSDHLSAGVYFENELAVNGWRMLTYTELTFDQLNMRQLSVIALGALFIILMPLIYTVRGTVAQVRSNRRISEALLFDPVTGGNNFLHFKIHAERLLGKRKYRQNLLAFAVVDIKRFRMFTDLHGASEGELLLVRIFNTLRRNLKRDELLTRLSADQFSLLLILTPGEDPVLRTNRMLKALTNIYPSETILCSAGVYIVTDRKQSVDRMNNYATVAKDVAKHSVAGGTALFDNAMRAKLLSEQQISSLMDRALEHREFALYLQPKYSVTGKRLHGAEALVRWISPERGFVSPGDFIPLFEKNGFITRLDDYMLKAVCALLRRWIDEGRRLYPISVNLSRINFSDRSIAKHIRTTVDSYAVPRKYIELELTESAFFDDRERLLHTLNELRAAGFRISMDDFGSGFSSLNSLRELPLDVIKIDKDFFDDSGDTDRGKLIVRDTIRLAKDLDLTIVAEGVETREQVAFLESTDCDLIQGFYFGKPMPVEEFDRLS